MRERPSYGYGLSRMIFDYDEGSKNIQYGGKDKGEAARGYFHTKSKNGLIVFLNGENAACMLPKVIELLDEEQNTHQSMIIFSRNSILNRFGIIDLKNASCNLNYWHESL